MRGMILVSLLLAGSPLPTVGAQDALAIAGNQVVSMDHLVINVVDMERVLAFYKRIGFTLDKGEWRRGHLRSSRSQWCAQQVHERVFP
jgi:hypothetical protein